MVKVFAALKQEDFSFDPQNPPKKLGVAVCICNPRAGGQR